MSTAADLRLVSGGQTGVDRAALDHAIAVGLAYTGWCPLGGWAEDLPEPPGLLARYPGLRETPDADPAQRTAWNVRDSDATLVLVAGGVVSPGTDQTVAWARRLGRPCAVVDVADVDAVRHVLAEARGALNIAGPRESEAPGMYARTRTLLEQSNLRPPAAFSPP